MTDHISLVLVGLLLGARHALDPDHIVAVSTILARALSVRRAAAIGALWGLGHSVTVVLAGGTMIVLRVVIPPRLAAALELGVAGMLVVLGVVNLLGGDRRAVRGALRPVVVGVVHGLAGSAAIALLVLTTVRDPAWAAVYLGLFSAGTILGMVATTSALAVPATLALRRAAGAPRVLLVTSGAVSVAVGVGLAARIGWGG